MNETSLRQQKLGSRNSSTFTSVSRTTMDTELKTLEYEAKKGVSCTERVRRVFVPVHMKETIYRDGDGITCVVVAPGSFLVLFYIYFWVFLALMAILTTAAASIDYEDNPVINTYGKNNLCIVFDYPPVTYFGASVWIPDLFFILSFEYWDHFRVYDAFIDQHITSGFYQFYRVCTFFETVAFICFTQIFATSPTESVTVHTGAYLLFLAGIWTLALKRFLYLNHTGYCHYITYSVKHFSALRHAHKCCCSPRYFEAYFKNQWWKYAGILYVAVLFINSMVIICIIVPDTKNVNWVATLYEINADVHLVTCNVIPVMYVSVWHCRAFLI